MFVCDEILLEKLTRFNLHGTILGVVGITLKLHCTRQKQGEFDHVENGVICIEPDVMIRNGHLLERDLFGIFKERIRPPYPVYQADRK